MIDQIRIFFNKYKYHFLSWGIYIVYETIMSGVISGHSYKISYLISDTIFNISLFYLHANVLLKNALEGKKKLNSFGIVFLVLIELIVAISLRFILRLLIQKYIHHLTLNSYYPSRQDLTTLLYRTIYFMGYGTCYYFLMRSRRQKQMVEEMEQQELKNLILEEEMRNELVLTQNTFLRAQINPDFLISTLTHLYNKTYISVPKAAESILSLSNIMQYALSKEAATGFVKLEKEISLIENFILLHQARQVHQTQLSFSYNKESLHAEFIPLVLMTLIENMLKHGKLDDLDNPATIKINYKNSVLRIETANKKSINSSIPSHGIGLKNIKERLFLAYGEMATFDYHLDTKGYFHTTIIVQL